MQSEFNWNKSVRDRKILYIVLDIVFFFFLSFDDFFFIFNHIHLVIYAFTFYQNSYDADDLFLLEQIVLRLLLLFLLCAALAAVFD